MTFKKKYFVLYTNCIPVKGAKRSIICDLQRGVYFHIPNSFVDFFLELGSKKVSNFIDKLPIEDKKIAISYIQFAEKHNLGFYTNSTKGFPQIDLNFYTPYKLQDIIIEFSTEIFKYRSKLIKELALSGVRFLELRTNEIELDKLIEFIKLFPKTRIRSFSLYLRYDNSDLLFKNINFLNQCGLLQNIILHSVDESVLSKYKEISIDKLKISSQKISNDACGQIDKKFFIPTLDFYIESLHHNNCLSRKLSIDRLGNFKNCPSIKSNFGNIKDTNLIDVLTNEEYLKLTKITKSQVNTCKDCEYRMICSDCRAFVDNIFDKPSKCNYDPYED